MVALDLSKIIEYSPLFTKQLFHDVCINVSHSYTQKGHSYMHA